MQLSSLMFANELWMDLVWTPREQNVEADVHQRAVLRLLAGPRVPREWPALCLDFPVLDAMVSAGQALYDELALGKLRRESTEAALPPAGVRAGSKRRLPLSAR
jgi:hypothetical protein